MVLVPEDFAADLPNLQHVRLANVGPVQFCNLSDVVSASTLIIVYDAAKELAKEHAPQSLRQS